MNLCMRVSVLLPDNRSLIFFGILPQVVFRCLVVQRKKSAVVQRKIKFFMCPHGLKRGQKHPKVHPLFFLKLGKNVETNC